MISSPPSRAPIPDDEDSVVLSFLEDSQETTVGSGVLGASKFRRKRVANVEISSPVASGPSFGFDSQMSPSPFDTSDLTRNTSFQSPPPSPPRYQPSTSAAILPTSEGRDCLTARTSSGKPLRISKKPEWKKLKTITDRRAATRAQKEAYYGVDIHRLLDKIERDKGTAPHRYSSFRSLLTVVTKIPSRPISPKISGQINTARRNLWTYWAMNVSIGTSCAG